MDRIGVEKVLHFGRDRMQTHIYWWTVCVSNLLSMLKCAYMCSRTRPQRRVALVWQHEWWCWEFEILSCKSIRRTVQKKRREWQQWQQWQLNQLPHVDVANEHCSCSTKAWPMTTNTQADPCKIWFHKTFRIPAIDNYLVQWQEKSLEKIYEIFKWKYIYNKIFVDKYSG